jgi:hypothetical protein
MPISRVAALWGFKRRQKSVRRRWSALHDRCVSMANQHAVVRGIQEAHVAATRERFTEHDHGSLRRRR